jgi:predicted dehydrogenase
VVTGGSLGTLTTVNCDFYIGAHWYGGFRERMRHVLLLDMAIHTFDQVRFLTGSDPRSVYCHEWNPPGSWYERDASAVAIFEMSGNMTFVYRGSWCCEGCNTSWMADWRFAGTRGSALWDGAGAYRAEEVRETAEMTTAKDQVPKPQKVATPLPIDETRVEPLAFTAHAGVMRDFLDCVRTGGTPLTAASDNIKSLSMVFAAIESAEAGTKVGIPAGGE